MTQLLVVLPIVLMVVFGVPHGALDGAIIFQAFSTPRYRLVLLLGYLMLSAFCVLLWLAAPTLCLAIFLILSVWHFGHSDQARVGQVRSHSADTDVDHTRANRFRSNPSHIGHDRSGHTVLHVWRIVSDGGIWVLLVPFSHQSAVHELFVALGADADVILQAIDWLILPWVILAVASVAERIFNGIFSSAVIALSFAALAVMAPPLWSLCVYFCAWHSRRHVIGVLSDLPNPKIGWLSMILLTAATVLLALVAAIWLPVSALWSTAVIQIFFIGLFALTVPHMLLIDLYLPFVKRAEKRHSFSALDFRSR